MKPLTKIEEDDLMARYEHHANLQEYENE